MCKKDEVEIFLSCVQAGKAKPPPIPPYERGGYKCWRTIVKGAKIFDCLMGLDLLPSTLVGGGGLFKRLA